MKIRRIFLKLLIIANIIVQGCSSTPLQLHPSLLTFKSLNFSIPSAGRLILDNGIILYLMEDHELPLLNVKVMIRTGSVYEPDDKVGLASITGSVMRTGGTKFMTGDEIDDELEFIAGSIETGIGSEFGYASLSVLKKDMDRGLKLLADTLMYPVFDQKKLELKKKQTLEALRRQNDNPKSIAHREFNKIIYKGHPYGRHRTEETINNITREDLIDFHKKYFFPNNVMIGVTGDFDRVEILKKLNLFFNDWKTEQSDSPEIPPVKKRFYNSVNYIFKDISQTVIQIGHLGIKRNNPDFYTLQIMNYILGGGGFQSRLMKEIRADKGLAYSIWSSFGAGHREFGVFSVSCETKTSSTAEVIESIIKNIRGIMERHVTDEELNTAKKHITNSFIFRFTSKEQIVNQLMYIEYFGLPENYLETYRDNMNKVTKEDIQKAAQKYLHPDKLIFLVVGDKDKFDRPLATFGDVNVIELAGSQ